MWERLESVYSDTSMSIQAVYEQLKKLKPVREDDISGLVKFVNKVELCHSQLVEIDQVNSITMSHVDDLTDLIRFSIQKEWLKTFNKLERDEKIHPFSSFMNFLMSERDVAIRLAERNSKKQEASKNASNSTMHTQSSTTDSTTESKSSSQYTSKFIKCAIHKQSTSHSTSQCGEFKKLNLNQRLDALKQARACFKCLGPHLRTECKSKGKCSVCNLENHHFLLCRNANKQPADKVTNAKEEPCEETSTLSMHNNEPKRSSLFAIQYAAVPGSANKASLFFDTGSNTTYITHSAASRIHAKRLHSVSLDISTIGKDQKSYSTCLYEVKLISNKGILYKIQAYGMETITGPVSPLESQVVSKLFPKFEPSLLTRQSTPVDILIGLDYYGLHPRKEIAKSGNHLYVMGGDFGSCIQGSHPELGEFTQYNSSLFQHTVSQKADCHFANTLTHLEFKTPSTYSNT